MQDDDFLANAVAHDLISSDMAARLARDSKQQNLSAEAFAIKCGVIKPWQLETLRVLNNPSNHVPGFHIDSVLGKGGFGIVYKATQINLDRQVALKTIPLSSLKGNSATKRFEREAKIIGSLRHPNIVAAHDFGYHKDLLYLSLELVDGKDLSNLLESRGQLDEFTTWHMLRQVASALLTAQELNVTHRDIKPSNLILTSTPTGFPLPENIPFVKVADFGLACFTQAVPGDNTITLAGTGLGTPSYVAPEQLTGAKVDQRADIYAMAATAVHMLMGKPPYHMETPAKVFGIKSSGKENWSDMVSGQVSESTESLIRSMSQYDSDARIADHRVLIKKIDQVLEGLSPAMNSGNASTIIDGNSQDSDDFIVASQFLVDPSRPNLLNHGETTEVSIDGYMEKPHETSVIPKPNFRFKFLISVVSLVGLAVILLSVFVFPGSDSTISEIELASNRVVQIYDGFKLNESAFNVHGGQWQKFVDEEGGRVVLGSNCKVSFPCSSVDAEPFKYFRFSVGVKLNDARLVSFWPDGFDFSLVLDQEGYFLQQKKSVADITEWDVPPTEQTGYVNIEIIRNNAYWKFLIDREEVGSVKTTDFSFASIQLQTKGKSLFENPKVAELLPVEPDSP